jgi:glyoxylase-like metal-dependent hydrolase (beta-lactamase superfamily II)
MVWSPDPQVPDLSDDLVYPFAAPPDHEAFIEVAPGVRWLRFPLPFALNHINLWLLEDGDGWTLVDTGIGTDLSRHLWEGHFQTTLEGRPIHTILVTHYHPDHIGCAGWLARRWRPRVLMTRGEWLTARMTRAETGADATEFWGDFLRDAGLDEATILAVANRGERYGAMVEAIPRPFERVIDGDTLTIGGRRWRVVIGTGHAPEMICLYAEADRLFISADQVLPRISPNVGVLAPEPLGDPLTEFLDTTRKLRALDPGALVLPMHGLPFYGLHERLTALASHHAERLEVTLDACREPRTIASLLPILFKRTLDFQQMQFAVGEALAHTNHLVSQGALARVAITGQPTRFVRV